MIADITNPRSTPLELQATVPEYAMFQDLWVKYCDWVFAPVSYAAVDELAQGLDLLIKRAQGERGAAAGEGAERSRTPATLRDGGAVSSGAV